MQEKIMDIRINPINFTAKINKNIDTKSIKKATAAVSTAGLGLVGLNETEQYTTQTPVSPDYYMDIKASKIKRLIRKRIKNNATLTIREISKKTKIPENQVITILYRCKRYPELKEMFDQVKDISHISKPLEDSDYEVAANIVSNASVYNTTTTNTAIDDTDTDTDTDTDNDINIVIGAEADYVTHLAENIKKALVSRSITKDSLEVFSANFEEFPAFADTILSVKSPNINKMRTISSAENMQLLFDAYRLNPEITEETLTAINEEGGFKYSTYEIYKIAYVTSIFPELREEVKKDPKTIFWLTSMENEYYNQRFWANEIKELYDWYKKNPSLTKQLIQTYEFVSQDNNISNEKEEKSSKAVSDDNDEMTEEEIIEDKSENKNSVKRIRPKFDGNQIIYLLEQNDKYPDIVMYLLNSKDAAFGFKFSADDIIKALNELEVCNKLGLSWHFGEVDNKKELKKLRKVQKIKISGN